MEKRNIILLMFLCFCITAVSQKQLEFSVVSFTEKPFDTAARDERYKIVDGNGDLFSIIKLVSNNAGDDLRAYSFDFGLCENRVKQVGGEVWVYVQRNAMRVTITHAGYKTVRYELNTTVQPGRVYEMLLSVAPKVVKKRHLLFKVVPADSKAQVFYKAEGESDYRTFEDGQVNAEGMLSDKLVLGKYYYKIVSPLYYSTEGVIELTDKSDTYVENVTLRPNFGTMALTADAGCEIFVDGKSKGHGSHTGNYYPGFYNVECRKENHHNGVEMIEVKEGETTTVALKSPVPITGALDIVSEPLEATVTIDGKVCGVTPVEINGIIIGSHKVAISKDGYRTGILTVDVEEGKIAERNVVLEKAIHEQAGNETEDSPESVTLLGRKNDCRRLTNSFYLELAGEVGHLMDIGLNAGCYLSGFNMEVYGYYGFQRGEFYSSEKKYTVFPVVYGFRIGGSCPVGKRFALTPQVGIGALTVAGEGVRVSTSTFSIGVRCEFFVTSKFGISFAPEYVWGYESDLMKMLQNVCPATEKWCGGASARFGLHYNF